MPCVPYENGLTINDDSTTTLRLYPSPTSSGQVIFNGKFKVKLQCSSPYGVTLPIAMGVGSTPAPMDTMPGLSIEVPREPQIISLPGVSNCPSNTLFASAYNSYASFNLPIGGACYVEVDFPVIISANAGNGAISGEIPNATDGNRLARGMFSTAKDWVVFDGVGTYGISGTLISFATNCTLAADSVTQVVNLPSVKVQDFSLNPNPAYKTFNVSLQGCDAQTPAYVANAVWTLNNVDASGTVMVNASGAGNANGVGVQLLQGDSNGSIVSNGMTTMLAHVTAAGAYSTSFTARYALTGAASQVTAGAVGATATFVLSYQ